MRSHQEPAQQFDVFLSYATVDSADFAKSLGFALEKKGITVWRDRDQMNIGDWLPQGIGRGMTQSRFAVLILSPGYVNRNWTRMEFQGLFSREIDTEQHTILPVLHNLCREELPSDLAMLLNGRVLGESADFEQLVEELARAVGTSPNRHNDRRILGMARSFPRDQILEGASSEPPTTQASPRLRKSRVGTWLAASVVTAVTLCAWLGVCVWFLHLRQRMRATDMAATAVSEALAELIEARLMRSATTPELESSVTRAVNALDEAPLEGSYDKHLDNINSAALSCVRSGRDALGLLKTLMSLHYATNRQLKDSKDYAIGQTTLVHEAAISGSIECLRFLVGTLQWNRNLIAHIGPERRRLAPVEFIRATFTETQLEDPHHVGVNNCLRYLLGKIE